MELRRAVKTARAGDLSEAARQEEPQWRDPLHGTDDPDRQSHFRRRIGSGMRRAV